MGVMEGERPIDIHSPNDDVSVLTAPSIMGITEKKEGSPMGANEVSCSRINEVPSGSIHERPFRETERRGLCQQGIFCSTNTPDEHLLSTADKDDTSSSSYEAVSSRPEEEGSTDAMACGPSDQLDGGSSIKWVEEASLSNSVKDSPGSQVEHIQGKTHKEYLSDEEHPAKTDKDIANRTDIDHPTDSKGVASEITVFDEPTYETGVGLCSKADEGPSKSADDGPVDSQDEDSVSPTIKEPASPVPLPRPRFRGKAKFKYAPELSNSSNRPTL